MCQSVAESRGLTEQLEPDSAGAASRVGNPDSQIYGSKWPANRLTYGQMRTLRQISKDVRVPITQLLKDAVDVYLMVIQREMQAMMVAEQAGKSEDCKSDATVSEQIDAEPRTLKSCDTVSPDSLDTNATNAAPVAVAENQRSPMQRAWGWPESE